MRHNPAYYLLKNQPAALQPFIVKNKQGKSYLLIYLNEAPGAVSFKLYGSPVKIDDEHITVYEEYKQSNVDHGLSAFHYTARCQNGLEIHSYFDQYGSYLYSTLKNKNSFLNLSDAEKNALKKFSVDKIREPLQKLLNVIQNNDVTRKNEIEDLLKILEVNSKNGFDSKYLKLLNQTINKIEASNKLSFDPDIAVLNLLSKHKLTIPTLTQKKKVINSDFNNNNTSEDFVTSAETKQDSNPSSTIIVAPKLISKIEIFQNTIKELQQELKQKSSTESLFRQDKLITILEDNCEYNNINDIHKITQYRDNFNGNLLRLLITLTRKNDFQNIKSLIESFGPYLSSFSYLHVLSIACFYNFEEIIFYVLPLNKIKNDTFVIESDEIYTQKGQIVINFGFLKFSHLALLANNFKLFSFLLDQGYSDPNALSGMHQSISLLQMCFLNHIINKNNSLPFAEKLLQHGAEVDAVIRKMSHKLMSYDKNGKLVEVENNLTAKEFTASNIGRTAIHLAAFNRNEEGVKLLLKYKANTHIRDSEGFTAFGLAAYSQYDAINVSILKAIQEAGGHHIDERQRSLQITCLYYACQFQKLEDVKILLSLGADAFAEHMSDVTTGTGAVSQAKISPLSKVATKNNLSLLKLLMEFLVEQNKPISHKELQRIILLCGRGEISDYIYPYYYSSRSQAALLEYKSENYSVASNLFKSILTSYPPKDPNELRTCYYNYASSLFKEGHTLFSKNQSQPALDKLIEAKEKFGMIKTVGNQAQKDKTRSRIEEIDKIISLVKPL